jgi:predicted dehydrogenase
MTYGMVGGGQGAFIGDVHRKAISLDGLARLAAGSFSRDAANNHATGQTLGVEAERCYASYAEMAKIEAGRADGIDFVVIVTPNDTHYTACKAFLEAGIPVVCDKPLCFEVSEAKELAALAKAKDLLFCVTYTYTGYPAVKEIRQQVKMGALGTLRFVQAEYAQEWLATAAEQGDNRQAAWRTDPRRAGKSNSVGDIGSHIENLVSYTTGLRIRSLCARLDTFVDGRTLDDNASILVEYEGGAKGLYWASQIAVGSDNGFRLRLIGSTGAIEWSQENPNYFTLSRLGQPAQRWSRGRDGFHPQAQAYSRIPAGHPEGYFEAFANLYKTFILALAKIRAGGRPTDAELDFPTVEAGIDGVAFIDKCVESSKAGARWVTL